MSSVEDMSLAELAELLSTMDTEKLLEMRASELSKLTANNIDELEEDDDGLFDDSEFIKICEDRKNFALLSEVEQETARRWSEIESLRDHYAKFEDFLYDCMTELMGFQCSPLQISIGEFLESDVTRGMVQAQRSQAKSTIVAMFSVWQLIHDCRHRVLIVSAGSDVALEIANWVIQIIMNWDILECMRPDKTHGDRASSKAFDIHWQLKGAEKSPSLACIGITANMQGRRADLLIPDDIESSKNGMTELQRAALIHLSKDFTSICQNGRIMYLGTPQTVDSIYNSLAERGYVIRVWTGRFPTIEEEIHYGDTLAPFIRELMEDNPSLRIGGGLDGSRGRPTDPVILDEAALGKKELDQGEAYFNLQHMLNTEMSDELRHPLKTRNLIVTAFPIDKAPGEYIWMPSPEKQIIAKGFISKPQLYRPFSVGQEMYDYEGKHMYVDTAGGGKNGDETVAAVSYSLHGYILLAEILRLKGGFDAEVFNKLTELAIKHGVNQIDVEKNFGFGSFAATWRPILLRGYRDRAEADKHFKYGCPAIEDVWETGQKELRIIDTLEPILARHKLILHEDIIQYDIEASKKYPVDQQESYKFLHQFAKISRDKGSLIHDDSADAVAGTCRYWVDRLAIDETIRMEQKVTDDNVAFFKLWGGDIGKNQNGVLGLSQDRFKKRTHTMRKRR